MILLQREGRYDPKDLEGVLSVLDRRLYDGGDGGVVLCTGLCAEASADLEFGLRGTEGFLAVIVRGRDSRVRQEGEDVVPVLDDALLEFIQFGVGTVRLGVDRRSGKKLIQPLIHLCPNIQSDVSLVPMVYGVAQKIQHVKAPLIVREGLHRVCEVPQQVCDAYLVVLHPDIPHEVCRPAVGHPDLSFQFLRGEVAGNCSVAPAAVEGKIRSNAVLESPEPVVLAADVDSGLVCSGNFATGNLMAYHLVGLLGELLHRVQHIGYGPLAYVKAEDGLQKFCKPFERHVLICAQIGHESRNVRAEVYGGIHGFREQSLAAVAAAALDLHLKMIYDLCGYWNRYVNLLPSCVHGGGVHIQGLAAYGADGCRIPVLGSGDVVGLEPRASLMSFLPAGLPSGRLALGLRVRNAYGVLRRRHAAVRTGLGDRFREFTLKFRYSRLEGCVFSFVLGNLFIPADKISIKDIIGTNLLVKLFRQLRGVKILGVPHLPKELFASAGKFYPVIFDAPAKPCVEVLFHATKIGKGNGYTKFNELCINGLMVIYRLSDELCTFSFGGSCEKFFRALQGLLNSNNRLIFNGLKIGCATR